VPLSREIPDFVAKNAQSSAEKVGLYINHESECRYMAFRSSVWKMALDELVQNDEFRLSDLSIEGAEKDDFLTTINEMEAVGWLRQDQDDGTVWKPGEKMKALIEAGQ
jgi:hypothetical protein